MNLGMLSALLKMFGNSQNFCHRDNIIFDDIYDVFE